jgi:hypothetical protein
MGAWSQALRRCFPVRWPSWVPCGQASMCSVARRPVRATAPASDILSWTRPGWNRTAQVGIGFAVGEEIRAKRVGGLARSGWAEPPQDRLADRRVDEPGLT